MMYLIFGELVAMFVVELCRSYQFDRDMPRWGPYVGVAIVVLFWPMFLASLIIAIIKEADYDRSGTR